MLLISEEEEDEEDDEDEDNMELVVVVPVDLVDLRVPTPPFSPPPGSSSFM